eukprot:5719796-Amphidinium_carterae.1
MPPSLPPHGHNKLAVQPHNIQVKALTESRCRLCGWRLLQQEVHSAPKAMRTQRNMICHYQRLSVLICCMATMP